MDKLVGDIYGEDYQGLGLSADTVASSFGKLVNAELREHVTKADLAASLVQVVSTATREHVLYLCIENT